MAKCISPIGVIWDRLSNYKQNKFCLDCKKTQTLWENIIVGLSLSYKVDQYLSLSKNVIVDDFYFTSQRNKLLYACPWDLNKSIAKMSACEIVKSMKKL